MSEIARDPSKASALFDSSPRDAASERLFGAHEKLIRVSPEGLIPIQESKAARHRSAIFRVARAFGGFEFGLFDLIELSL